MGKRSRKRTGAASVTAEAAEPTAPSTRTGPTRAERDAARARRAAALRKEAERPQKNESWSDRRRKSGRPTIDDRPPAPWGSFPLVELLVFAALVMLIVGGLFVDGDLQRRLVLAALAIGSLAGLELSIREHFAGYRSHSTVLAGVIAFVCMMVVAIAAGQINLIAILGVGVSCFTIGFYFFRQAFKRRSGGVGFR